MDKTLQQKTQKQTQTKKPVPTCRQKNAIKTENNSKITLLKQKDLNTKTIILIKEWEMPKHT